MRVVVKNKYLLIALFVLLFFGVIGAFMKYLSKPAVGIVSHSQFDPSAETANPKYLTRTGKYIAFSYPGNFKAAPQPQPSGTELETFSLARQPSPFWFLNITVSSLPSGNLNDDGSYNMRILNSARYKKSSLSINGVSVTSFFDATNGYAKTAFISHDGKDVSVSLQSNDTPNSDQLDQVFENVISSLKWLN